MKWRRDVRGHVKVVVGVEGLSCHARTFIALFVSFARGFQGRTHVYLRISQATDSKRSYYIFNISVSHLFMRTCLEQRGISMVLKSSIYGKRDSFYYHQPCASWMALQTRRMSTIKESVKHLEIL